MTKVLVNKILLLAFMLAMMGMASGQSISYKSYYDFSVELTFDDSYSVNSQEAGPAGLEFSPDGMKMFIIGFGSDAVQQYSLSSPYDVTSTVSHDGTYSVSAQDISPFDVTFSQDGLTMFVLGYQNRTLHEYSLSAPFDITSTVTYTTNTISFVGAESRPYAALFSSDGTKMWICGEDMDINQYGLSTPYDLSSVSYQGTTAKISTNHLHDLQFNADGTRLFVLEGTTGISDFLIKEYELAVAFDVISGMTETETSFSPVNEEAFPESFAFSKDGNRLFVTGTGGDDVNQYDFGDIEFFESLSNDGSLGDSRKSFALTDETFTNQGGVLAYSTDFTISNLPTGLTPIFNVSSDGSFAELSFTGNATNNQLSDGVDDLIFTFENSAFTGGNASAVTNATSANTGISLVFRDKSGPFIAFGRYGDLAKAIVNETTFSVAGQETVPQGMSFSSDGMKVFMIGTNGDAVYQYNLTTPFDVTSGVSYSGFSTDVSSEISFAVGLAFDPTGTKMFVLGAGGDDVNQYSLSTGFDLNSTVTFDGSPFSVSAQTGSPHGIDFNADGSKMYIGGGLNMHEYDLTTPYDVTSGVSFAISSASLDASIRDFVFDPTGTKLYVAYSSAVYIYDLPAPYTIAYGIELDQFVFLSSIETSIMGLTFSSDRSKFHLLGSTGDDITQFDLFVDGFEESAVNDGSIANSKTISIVDDFFTNAGGTLLSGVDYSISGVPSGLIPNLSVAADGLSADLSFTGSATANSSVNNVSNLQITFNNSAFASGNASNVVNAQSGNSYLDITFNDAAPIVFNKDGFEVLGDIDLSNNFLGLSSPNPYDATISPDGTKLFYVDLTNDEIEQVTLTVPFQPVLGATNSISFSVAAQEGNPTAVSFNSTGTKMFVLGNFSDAVHQYTLSTPFDISTAIYDDISFSVKDEESIPSGMAFSTTGHRLYITGFNDDMIHQYKLKTPFDLSGGGDLMYSYDFDFESNASAISISADGSRMYLTGTDSRRIYQYNMTENYNLSTAVYELDQINLSGIDTNPSGVSFSSNGQHLYVSGRTGDRLRQYDLSLSDFNETGDNEGAIDGSFTFGIAGGKFTNGGATLSYPADFTITNLPDGLIPVITVSANGQEAVLTFSGNATNHQDVDDVADFTVNFQDGAFNSGDASKAINGNFTIDARINFDNNPQLTYTNGYNLINGASFNDSFYIGNNENGPQGIAFSNDGLTMFVVGAGGDEVNQYTLTNPYDIVTGVSFDGILNLSDAAPSGITFNKNGTKMYYIGYGSDQVFQYTLTTPFQVTSGASLDGTVNISAQDIIPQGLALSRDGDKLFVLGGLNDQIFQFSINDAFDITSGVVYDNVSFSIATEDDSPGDIQFNPDGTKLFYMGLVTDKIYQYSLTNPYDLSTGVTYDGISLDVSNEESQPFGFAFGRNGTRIFVCGNAGQDINQYELVEDGFVEVAANTGGVEGLQGIQLSNDTFVNAGGTLESGVHYSLTGVPAGLSSSMVVDPAGTFATLTLSGKAGNNQNEDDVANLEITFLDAAFNMNLASGIFNSENEAIAGVDFEDNSPQLVYGDLYDLDNLKYTGTSMNVDTDDTSMHGIAFNSDGTKMFLVGATNDAVYQYSLDVPFDITTGVTYTGNSFSVATEESAPLSLAFSTDGSKMFIMGSTLDEVHQYSLSTSFDLSSSVNFVDSYSVNVQEGSTTGITFNGDGSKMYITGSDDEVNQYTLSTPFDITSGVTFDGSPFYYGDRQSNPHGIAFSPSGLSMFILGSSGDRIEHFKLAKSFDVTSQVLHEGYFLIGEQDVSPTDLTFSADGSRLFVVGASDGDINQYDFRFDPFIEGSRNDGSLDGEQIIFVMDDEFVNPSGQLSHGTHFEVNNLPTGLEPILTVNGEGSSAVLTFDSKAANNQNIDDLSSLVFTFNDEAFVSGNVSVFPNATNEVTKFDLDFRDNNPALLYGDGYNLAVASYSGNSLDVSLRDTYLNGVAFNGDGTKLFTAGNDNDEIFEYNLTEPYNLSGAVDSGNSLDISVNAADPLDIYFSQDGTRLYILSNINYEVVQYNLSSAFDLSSASYSGNSLSVEAQDDSPYGLTFSPDGSKMYVAGSDSYAVNQYEISTAFEVSTASFSFAFSVENDEESPSGIVFSQDGRYLIVVGDNNGEAIRYALNVPFDLALGANLDAVSLDMSSEDSYPTGITTSPDGGRLFISGSESNTIYQYNIDIGGFAEAVANDGAMDGELKLIAFDETFANAGGSLTHGVDYTITNLPSGFAPSMDVAADGYSATLTLTGSADIHGDAQDISGLEFNFGDTAFPNYLATEVSNAMNHNSQIEIDFLAYTGTDILTFELAEQTDPAIIDNGESSTITVEVTAGTDISALTPTITVSTGAIVSPNSGVEQDFTNPVTYTITAEDGGDATMEVTVTEAIATPTDITLSSTSVDEESTLGTVVGTLSAVDANFEETFTFNVVSTLENDDWQSFDISGNNLVTTDFIALDFESKNTFTFDVSVQDSEGEIFEKEFTITLNDLNEAPTDILLSNATVNESTSAGAFVGSLSAVDEDANDSHTYALKEGNVDNESFDIEGGNLVTLEELDFETKDTYNLEIIVTDQGDLTFEQEFAISVINLPAQITSIDLNNTSINENVTVGTVIGTFTTFGEDLSGSFTYDLVSGVGGDDNGSFSTSSNQLLTGSDFNFESQDSYSVRVMVDDGSLTFEEVFMISVNDISEAPSDISLVGTSIPENNAIGNVIGTLSTTDEDAGESFTYNLVIGAGDEDNASFDVVDNELQAAVIFDFEAQDSYSVRIETNDGNGGTFSKSFTISITNENESILVSNPIADQDLDEGFTSLEIDLSNVFTDQDGDALTYEVSSSNETIVMVSNSAALMTISEAGAFGPSTITVTADDGSGVTSSDEFIVTVSNVNDAPVVANEISDQNVNEGFGSVEIDISGTFTDADGDALTFSVESSDKSVVTISEAGNTLTIAEVGNGVSTVTVTANDGNGGTASDEFVVIVNNVNDAPVVGSAISDQSVNEGFGSVEIDISGTFTDEDGDALTYSVSSSDETVVMISASNATLTISEVGLGTSTITVTANDGNGESVSDEFTFTVNEAANNTPIVVNPLDDQTSVVEGFDAAQFSYADVFEDADGDVLTITVNSSDETVVTVEVIANDQIQVNEVGIGTSTITLTADDGNGGTVSDEFIFTVNEAPNNAPVVVSPLDDQTDVEEGFDAAQFSYADVFEDADGDALTIAVSSSNENVVTAEVISNNQIQVNEAGIGTSTITLTADDGNGGTVSDEFIFTVNEAQNNAPIVVNPLDDQPSVVEGFDAAQFSYADVFEDADGDALTITVSSSDETVVTVEVIANDQIQVNEVGIGTSTITLTADDGKGGTVSDEFIFTVNEAPNNAPVVVNPLDDQTEVEEGFGAAQFSYAGVFEDADGDALTITVSSSDETVVTAEVIANDQIQINEVGIGTATIILTADDGNGGSVSDEFIFTVNEAPLGIADLEVKIYPNPSSDFIYVNSNEELSVRLTDLNGREIQSKSGSQLEFDIQSLSSGLYILQVSDGDHSTNYRVIKPK